MSDADLAYAAAVAEIARVRAEGGHTVKLSGKSFSRLDRLPQELISITGLGRLDLSRTAVRDLSILSQATRLQSLNLSGTMVSELQPLAEISGLRNLNLTGTRVKDLRPIAFLNYLGTGGHWGLWFSNTPATNLDQKLASLADIVYHSARTNQTLA
jgi:internalin A